MSDKNEVMKAILQKATKSTSNKSYESEDKKVDEVTPVKKEGGSAGRKKVTDKKRPKQVFYNNAEFKVIENLAEEMGVDSRVFMQMAINQKVKELTKNKED
jgi:hypothetical protein